VLIVSYDFEKDSSRNRFSKFLKRFGGKIQYSVYEIRNSQRVLQNIIDEIELSYKKDFSGADSILIFSLCEACKKKIIRYGYAKNEEGEVIVFK